MLKHLKFIGAALPDRVEIQLIEHLLHLALRQLELLVLRIDHDVCALSEVDTEMEVTYVVQITTTVVGEQRLSFVLTEVHERHLPPT